MSPILIAIVFGLGVGGFAYSKLTNSTGNANPASTVGAAVAGGIAAAIVLFTLLKFVFNF